MELRLVVGTGVLGGFTTYSAFNLETLRMLQQGQAPRAVAYLLATLLGCLLAGWLGLGLGRALRGLTAPRPSGRDLQPRLALFAGMARS